MILAVQVVDPLVEFGGAGGVGFGLGGLVVEVEPGEVEPPPIRFCSFLVHVVFPPGGVEFKVTRVGLHGDGGFLEKINAIHSRLLLYK